MHDLLGVFGIKLIVVNYIVIISAKMYYKMHNMYCVDAPSDPNDPQACNDYQNGKRIYNHIDNENTEVDTSEFVSEEMLDIDHEETRTIHYECQFTMDHNILVIHGYLSQKKAVEVEDKETVTAEYNWINYEFRNKRRLSPPDEVQLTKLAFKHDKMAHNQWYEDITPSGNKMLQLQKSCIASVMLIDTFSEEHDDDDDDEDNDVGITDVE